MTQTHFMPRLRPPYAAFALTGIAAALTLLAALLRPCRDVARMFARGDLLVLVL